MGAKRYWDPQESMIERLPNEIVASHQQPGIMATPHWHAQAEINYVLRGAIDYEMPGYSVRIGAGDLALFWGGLPHRVSDTEEDTDFHVIHLPLLHFFRLRLSPHLQQRLMHGSTIVSAGTQPEDDLAFARRAQYLASSDPRLVQHAVDELLVRIERIELGQHAVHEPKKLGTGASVGAEQPSFQSIGRLFAYIAENFRDDIDCVDIAVSADIHPKYAMNVFKKSTGMSLGEYVTLLRLSYAQALLMKEDINILQIAMDSGFGSVSAFNKCFRKQSGMTPSEFKRERSPSHGGLARS